MKSLKITLNLCNIGDDEYVIETSGILINKNKKHYIVSVHQGLPIKSVKINNIIITDIIVCGWNDLIIINLTLENLNKILIENTHLYVFKLFVQKQINVSVKCFIDENHVKYIENTFMPVNMIPMNPDNMYYMMNVEKHIIVDGDAGKPIYSNNKLIGILSKMDDDIMYVIPAFYLLRALEKTDNDTIYTIDIENIAKIKRYRVINNKVYYTKINTLIPLDTMILLEGDKNIKYDIMTNNIRKRDLYNPFTNMLIKNNTMLNIDKCMIQINSCLIHLIKICYKDIDIIERIFRNMEIKEVDNFECTFNNTSYCLSF